MSHLDNLLETFRELHPELAESHPIIEEFELPSIEQIKQMLADAELKPKIDVIDYSSNMTMHNDKFDALEIQKVACKMSEQLKMTHEEIYANDTWRKHDKYRWK